MIRTSFMNLYRAGYFHRKGKPGNLDAHGGDLYDTEDLANDHIHPRSHFIGTVKVVWDDPGYLETNLADSIPVPLSITRKEGEYATV